MRLGQEHYVSIAIYKYHWLRATLEPLSNVRWRLRTASHSIGLHPLLSFDGWWACEAHGVWHAGVGVVLEQSGLWEQLPVHALLRGIRLSVEDLHA